VNGVEIPLSVRRGELGSYVVGTRDGVRTAVICCPVCGIVGALEGTHEIGEDGTIFPSVDCPGCSWHENVRLLGWNPEP